jgi:hypothetical protein
VKGLNGLLKSRCPAFAVGKCYERNAEVIFYSCPVEPILRSIGLLQINPDAYSKAAAHYGEASRIASIADALKAREYLRSQAAALVRLGDEFGDNAALQRAIELMRTAPAAGPRQHVAPD